MQNYTHIFHTSQESNTPKTKSAHPRIKKGIEIHDTDDLPTADPRSTSQKELLINPLKHHKEELKS